MAAGVILILRRGFSPGFAHATLRLPWVGCNVGLVVPLRLSGYQGMPGSVMTHQATAGGFADILRQSVHTGLPQLFQTDFQALLPLLGLGPVQGS